MQAATTPVAFPDHHAEAEPDRPAYVMARTGEVVTYGRARASARAARRTLMRDRGAQRGDCVAILMENHVRVPGDRVGGPAGGPALHGRLAAADRRRGRLHPRRLRRAVAVRQRATADVARGRLARARSVDRASRSTRASPGSRTTRRCVADQPADARSTTRPRASSSSTRRAPPGRPKAIVGRRCRCTRSARRRPSSRSSRACYGFGAGHGLSVARRRSTTRRRCASTWRCTGSAGRRS